MRRYSIWHAAREADLSGEIEDQIIIITGRIVRKTSEIKPMVYSNLITTYEIYLNRKISTTINIYWTTNDHWRKLV